MSRDRRLRGSSRRRFWRRYKWLYQRVFEWSYTIVWGKVLLSAYGVTCVTSQAFGYHSNSKKFQKLWLSIPLRSYFCDGFLGSWLFDAGASAKHRHMLEILAKSDVVYAYSEEELIRVTFGAISFKAIKPSPCAMYILQIQNLIIDEISSMNYQANNTPYCGPQNYVFPFFLFLLTEKLYNS